MTMQIGVVAKGGIVLASDTKHRTTERQYADDPFSVPSGIVSCSKITPCAKQDITIAFAGWSDPDDSAGEKLARHLDSLPPVTDADIKGVLIAWGDDYYQSRFSEGRSYAPLLTLLVARPSSRYPLLKLRVNNGSNVLSSEKYLVNGNESNTAIFWPEYFKVDKTMYDLQAATAIAGMTILMGGEINGAGVGGLEIWQYTNQWKEVSPEEIEGLRGRFDLLQRGIKKAVLPASKRGRLSPQPSQE